MVSQVIDKLMNYSDICGDFIKFSHQSMMNEGLLIRPTISSMEIHTIHDLFNEFKIFNYIEDFTTTTSTFVSYVINNIRYDNRLPIIITDSECIFRIGNEEVLFSNIIEMNRYEFKKLINLIKKNKDIRIFQKNQNMIKLNQLFNTLGIDNNKDFIYKHFIREKEYLVDNLCKIKNNDKTTSFAIFDFGVMVVPLIKEIQIAIESKVKINNQLNINYDDKIKEIEELKLKDIIKNKQDISILFSDRYHSQFIEKNKYFRKIKTMN